MSNFISLFPIIGSIPGFIMGTYANIVGLESAESIASLDKYFANKLYYSSY